MDTGQILFRAALDSDVAALVDLEQKCFDYYQLNTKKFRYFLTTANCDLVVAENKSGILAYALVIYRNNSKMGRLYSIAVDSSTRAQNLGSRLLLEMERRAAIRGCNKLKLEVNINNEKAVRFYQKNGYQEQKGIADFYPDGSFARVFCKQL